MFGCCVRAMFASAHTRDSSFSDTLALVYHRLLVSQTLRWYCHLSHFGASYKFAALTRSFPAKNRFQPNFHQSCSQINPHTTYLAKSHPISLAVAIISFCNLYISFSAPRLNRVRVRAGTTNFVHFLFFSHTSLFFNSTSRVIWCIVWETTSASVSGNAGTLMISVKIYVRNVSIS